jgi:hypothetical protein
MFILPYGHLQIKTKMNKETTIQRLVENTEPRKLLYGVFRGNHKFFEGIINGDTFNINRVAKSSFKPVIIGEIQQNSDQTVVNILVRFDYESLITIALLFLIVLFISLCLPLQFFIPSNISAFFRFVADALKIPSIIYLIIIGFFNYEVSNDLDDLNDLFKSN